MTKPSWRTKAWAWYVIFILAPAVVFFSCQLITLQGAQASVSWLGAHLGAALFTYLLLLALEMLLVVITGRLTVAVLTITTGLFALSLASHLKEVINGVPLLVSDFAMASRALYVAHFVRPGAAIHSSVYAAIALLLLLLVATILFAQGKKVIGRGWYQRLTCGLVAMVVLIGSFSLAPARAFLSGGVDEIQAERNDRLGVLAGIYSGLLDSAAQQPDSYNENNMNRILTQVNAASKQEETAQLTPHVIVLMSESFCDPREVLPNLTFSAEPIPNFRALSAQFPVGSFLSNTYGGGTGNVEMEVLTGIPLGLISEGEDLTSLQDITAYDRMPSIVKAFSAQGYSTQFVHSYTDRLYNRRETLPRIGFEKLLFETDFSETQARQSPYLSDMDLTQKIIEEFEDREADSPFFLFGLSMEAHQPHYKGKFTAPPEITISGIGLDDEITEMTEALLQGLHNADAALGALVAYFEACEEPVLVVFWGDHLPGLALSEADSSVYSRLGYSTTANTKTWQPDELARMHTTPFLIWNNYGAELEVPEQISAFALGSDVLGWAGISKPLHFKWVDMATQDMLLYRRKLFIAGDGTPYAEVPPESKKTADTYQSIVYDILYGEGYIANALTKSIGKK